MGRGRAGRRARAATAPAQSGWLADHEMTMPSQPGSAATFSQPEMPACHLGPDPVPHVEVGQGGDAGIHPEAEQGRRQDRGEGRRRGRVRVLVGPDVEPLGPGTLQQRDRLAGPAPHRAGAALEMRDLEPRPGHARIRRRAHGGDRLLEGGEHAGRLVAHVGGVQPATPGRGRYEQCHLVGSGVHPGRVDQPARQPERPGVHRRIDLADHRVTLQVVRGSPIRPDDRAAHRPVSDEEGDVRTERDLVDGIEVLAERPPARDELVGSKRQLHQLAAAIGERRQRVAAVPGQLGREALGEMADERAVDEQRSVGVSVRIDEPWRHGPSRDVDDRRDRPILDRREVADGQDPVAQDADIRQLPGCAGAIDHEAATQQQVERRHRWMMPPHVPAESERRVERVPGGPPDPLLQSAARGAIAQLGEHLHGMQGVRGSSPRSSTIE